MSVTQDRVKRVRNPRGQGGHLRDEIIEACTRLLDESASELTISLRSIAAEAGVAAPSIARHFRDLQEIIDAVVAKELEKLLRELQSAGTNISNPREKIAALTETYIDFSKRYPSRYRILFSRVASPRWEEDTRPMVETWPLMYSTFNLVRDTIQECIDAGLSRANDATESATMLWFGIHGLISLRQSITSFPWPDETDAVRKILQNTVHLI